MRTTTTERPSRWAIVAAFAAIYVIWGSTYLGILIAIETIPPFLMAGFRFFLAGLPLYLWMRGRGLPAATGGEWRWAILLGGLMLAGGNGVVTWAEQYVSSGLASLIVATVPIWMTGLEATVFGGKRLGVGAISGLALGMVGVALLASPGTAGADPRGIVALVLASLSWSIGSLLSRRASHSSPLALAGMQMIAGGVILMLWGTMAGEWSRLDVAAISARSWLALIYLITFGSIVALGSYVWLMRVSTPGAVSTYAFVNPVVALILGALFAGERLGPKELLATSVILGAVILLQLTRRREQPPVVEDDGDASLVGELDPVPARLPAVAADGRPYPRAVGCDQST